MNNLKKSTVFYKTITISVIAALFYAQLNGNGVHIRSHNDSQNELISSVNASEIYPMFTCPCCDQPLKKEEPCCGAMEEMISFIDTKISLGEEKEKIILSTAKEFGLERLTYDEDRSALKQKLIDLAPDNAPKIELVEDSKDLDKVGLSDGVVSTDFEFKNTGESDLVINELSSSCGCTSGAIVYKGEVGPKFTMAGHGAENPKDWSVSISPGDSAILRVYYDPSVHPDLTGAVTRSVSIMSNDPVEFEKQVIITLEQVK